MDTSQERGRRLSSNARHVSPQPSPCNFHDASNGLDPSITQSTFSTGRFNTAQAHDMTAPTTNLQPYMTSYTLNPNAMNSYIDQSISAGQFNPEFTLQQTSFTDSLNQDFMGQFPNLNQGGNVNPADLSRISSPEQRSPRLLSPDNHSSPGPQSPTSTNGHYHTAQHSRHVSLDPNSAYGSNDWQGMAFRQHQRAPSDVSDVSSVHGHSPYLHQVEPADSGHSPLFAAQDNSTFGLDDFTLNEQTHSQPTSSFMSPQMVPQQEGLGLTNDMLLSQKIMAPEMFSQDQSYQNMASIHARNHSVVSQIGQADQSEPPSITIEPAAPVSRQQSFGPPGEMMMDTLSPPSGNGRGRNRSQSDVTFTRPMSSGSRSTSPVPSQRHASLAVNRSPSPGGSISRSPSPGVSDGRITKERRASSASMNNNNREYILDLADPNRPNNSTGGNGTRVQKHPATFQCNLCPKRFTRAYNLRSHLRTHTDERPFVCTVCGKAFARQHDRKRHEGLHSGEKKFVCKGELTHSPGQSWGCGRRFARADALGRHFRSEAGRVCIKPLLDEEAAERRQKMMLEQQAHMNAQQVHMQTQGLLQPVPQTMMVPGMGESTGFALPAALLAQYPALGNIDWAALQAGVDDGDLSDAGYGYDDGTYDGHLSDSGLPTMGHNQWA